MSAYVLLSIVRIYLEAYKALMSGFKESRYFAIIMINMDLVNGLNPEESIVCRV